MIESHLVIVTTNHSANVTQHPENMRPKHMKATILGTAMVLAFGIQTHAANIALTDPSLEAPFTGVFGTTVSGWNTFGGATAAQNVTPGSFWGGAAGMSNLVGSNAAYAVNIGENDGGSIYQTVELDAGITYMLTVGIGTSTSVNKSSGKYALVFFSDGFGTLHAEKTGVVANQTGSFADDSVSFTPTVSAKYNVGMRNRGYVPGTGANNNESTIFFDNARLVAVPEPSAALLGGLGMLALLRRRRQA
jgi:hypothetical protein